MDLLAELKALAQELDRRSVAYGLCGGLAMAVHGHMRATSDIDLLVLAKDLDAALAAAQGLGFDLSAGPMRFAGERVVIHRLSKSMGEDEYALPLDFIVVGPELEQAWDSIQQVPWQGGTLRVLSPEGLRSMKSLRQSAQDKADLETLAALKRDAKGQ